MNSITVVSTVIICALIVVMAILANKNKELEKDNDSKSEKINDLKEKINHLHNTVERRHRAHNELENDLNIFKKQIHDTMEQRAADQNNISWLERSKEREIEAIKKEALEILGPKTEIKRGYICYILYQIDLQECTVEKISLPYAGAYEKAKESTVFKSFEEAEKELYKIIKKRTDNKNIIIEKYRKDISAIGLNDYLLKNKK